MEDLIQLPSVLWKGDFLCKIDLQDAYQSIPVAKKARVYLRFLWKGKLYQFTCLPFGLASSPRIFTKCLKPLLVYLQALGVRLLVYAGINLTGYHPPPGHPGAFAPKCVPSPRAFAQQKMPGGRANK